MRLCILHEKRQIVNIIETIVFSQTGIYLNIDDQENPSHPRVRKIFHGKSYSWKQFSTIPTHCLTFLFSIAMAYSPNIYSAIS